MDKFDIQVKKNNAHLIGYAVVCKSVCEVFNFVSPTFRILRILDGVVEWKIGQTFATFYPGDVVIFNNLHKRNIHKVLTGVIIYEIFDFLPSCLSDETLRHFFYTQIHKVASANEPNANEIYFLLNNLKKEMEYTQDLFQTMVIQHHLDLLSLAFYRSFKSQNPSINTALDNITRTVQYIRNHFTEDIRVSTLAANCGYSPAYFSRVFKKYLGVSPISYIINLRLENVTHLMSTTEMTILSAAYQSGFQTSSAFYKAFKTYKRVSPSQYNHKDLAP